MRDVLGEGWRDGWRESYVRGDPDLTVTVNLTLDVTLTLDVNLTLLGIG